MKNKKLTGILIAAVIILLVCVVGTTFAYYFAVLRGQNENTISTSKATLILTEQDASFDTVEVTTDENHLYSWTKGYDFSLALTSTGKTGVAYALYLEPIEGNTMDPNLISVNLAQFDAEGIEQHLSTYDYGMRCRNRETNEIVAIEDCRNIEEIRNEIEVWEEVDANSNNYAASSVLHNYYIDDISYICYDQQVYYDSERNDVLGSESVEVDSSYCKYINEDVPYAKSLPLAGQDSYKNVYGLSTNFNEKEKEELSQKYIIYQASIPANQIVNYRLRYFINSDRFPEGTAEGTVNADGSVSAELGQEGIFKFRIGVYAKYTSPSWS